MSYLDYYLSKFNFSDGITFFTNLALFNEGFVNDVGMGSYGHATMRSTAKDWWAIVRGSVGVMRFAAFAGTPETSRYLKNK